MAWGEGPCPEGGSLGGPATEGAGRWKPLASRLRSWQPACLWRDLGACRRLRSPRPALCSPRRLTGWIMWRSTLTTSSTDTSLARAEPTVSEGALQGARGSPCRALNRAPPEAGAEGTWGRVLVLRQTCRAGICPPEFTQGEPAGRAASAEARALSGQLGAAETALGLRPLVSAWFRVHSSPWCDCTAPRCSPALSSLPLAVTPGTP